MQASQRAGTIDERRMAIMNEVHDIMNVADIGEVMPPKSTWFEPKLRSGLFIHKLS